ncbi:MAG: tetratricopeptide repeat protein [Vulcanimicrobiaceae bacterium]
MQIASDAILSSAGSPYSLPAHLSPGMGVRIYTTIEWIAPAAYVEGMLTRAAFTRGDLDEAKRHALRLPESGLRDESLGRVAQAHGNERAAQRYYLASGDFFAIQDDVDRLSTRDPAAAYELELALKNRLQALKTHPDAVAETYWHLGQLATLRAVSEPRTSTRWLATGMHDYRRAVALAPLSEKYLLAAGSQALTLGDLTAARRYFARTLDVDPASADAYAGLGVVALRLGDRETARMQAARSRAIDPNSSLLHALETALR